MTIEKSIVKKSLAVALALVACMPTSAWSQVRTGPPDLMNLEHVEALQAIRAAIPRWTPIYLTVDCGEDSSCSISEHTQRIRLNSSRTSRGDVIFQGWADGRPVHLFANLIDSSDPSRGYNLSGAQANLSLLPAGDGYRLTGAVGLGSVNIMFNRIGSGWSMWGQDGLNMSLSGSRQNLTVSGSVDLGQFGPEKLAAVGSALAVLSSLPAPALDAAQPAVSAEASDSRVPSWFDASGLAFVYLSKAENGYTVAVLRRGRFELGVFLDAQGIGQAIFTKHALNPMGTPMKEEVELLAASSRRAAAEILRRTQNSAPVSGKEKAVLDGILSALAR